MVYTAWQDQSRPEPRTTHIPAWIARAVDKGPDLPMPEPTPIGRATQLRVARQIREASLGATPAEHVDLDRLGILLSTGDVTLPQADNMLRGLLRAQNQRRAA